MWCFLPQTVNVVCGKTVAAMFLELLKGDLDNTQPSEVRTYFIKSFYWWAVTLPTSAYATVAEQLF